MFDWLKIRLAPLISAVLLVVAVSATPALAQSLPTATDSIDLVGLTTRQPTPESPTNQVAFQATVNYHLNSAPGGSVLLFLFENSSSNSSQDTSNAIPIQRGNGQLVLNIPYTLKSDVKTLTLVAGMFKAEQHLLAWVSTNPIDMGPWPGRVYFEKAMAARLNNDFATADKELSLAIEQAPDTGNLYYWRADTRVRLDNYADAVSDFDRSIELMPQDRPSRVGRGIARLWLGDSTGAVEDLSLIIDRGATDGVTAWALRARGLAYANLGQSQSAVADYTRYLQLVPDASDKDQVQGWITQLS